MSDSDQGFDDSQHYNQCDDNKKSKDFSYSKYYGNWVCRKEKCKRKVQPKNEDFCYNGVYFSNRVCYPPLTDWLDVLTEEPITSLDRVPTLDC